MLDGSLIAFVALKLGLSCPAVFSELAFSARPRSINDRANVAILSEAACREENPDHAWIAAYIKTGFQSRVVTFRSGKVLLGKQVEELLKRSPKEELRQEVSAGVFLLSPRRMAEQAGVLNTTTAASRLKEALSPQAQFAYLEATEKLTYQEDCADGWLKCWVLSGASAKDKALWLSTEVVLAKAAAGLLSTHQTPAPIETVSLDEAVPTAPTVMEPEVSAATLNISPVFVSP